MSIPQLILAGILAAIVAIAAYKFRLLTLGGAWAAFALGTIVFGLGGFAWAFVLIAFFVTSSGLSYLFKKRKQAVEEKYSKGSRRDAAQVFANGGLAGAAVLFHVLFPQSVYPWIAFSAAFAAANADTWATELGVLNRTSPRLISTWKVVPAGTSGAISLIGTLATIAGSLLIALTAYLSWRLTGLETSSRLLLSGIVLVAGVFGSLVDSYIGATVQTIFWCPVCQKETEKSPLHVCGNQTELIRGWKWLNNDWVNIICTASAILVALLLTILVV